MNHQPLEVIKQSDFSVGIYNWSSYLRTDLSPPCSTSCFLHWNKADIYRKAMHSTMKWSNFSHTALPPQTWTMKTLRLCVELKILQVLGTCSFPYFLTVLSFKVSNDGTEIKLIQRLFQLQSYFWSSNQQMLTQYAKTPANNTNLSHPKTAIQKRFPHG